MPDMTLEQLQGAVMALNELLTGDPQPGAITRVVIMSTLNHHRAQLAAMPPQPDLPEFDDERVSTVYSLLCSNAAPPNKEEHWEGWVARQIVQAIGTKPQPDLRAALVEAKDSLEAVLDSIGALSNPSELAGWGLTDKPLKTLARIDAALKEPA